MNKSIYISVFALGVVFGSLVTRYVLKEKYEIDYQEEKNAFEKMRTELLESKKAKEKEPERPKSFYHTVSNYKTTSEDAPEDLKTIKEAEKEYPSDDDAPYVITWEEASQSEYECYGLTYYADGVVTGDDEEPIEDLTDIVGEDSLLRFGKSEDEDSIFVRNDRQGCDYEIVKSLLNYSDLEKPENMG